MAKLTPDIDRYRQNTMLLNLTVLQRVDPLVAEILLTASHVALYDFDIVNFCWTRKNVEGSLFVVKRNSLPRFQFIVMNRKSTKNLVEDLLGDFEFEVQSPFLFYRTPKEVIGAWFYEPSECEEIGRLFHRITKAYSKVPVLLRRQGIKSEFDELEDVPSLLITEGPGQPRAPSPTPDVAEDSPVKSIKPTSPSPTPDVADDSPVKSISAAVKDNPLDTAIAEQICAFAAIPEPCSHVANTNIPELSSRVANTNIPKLSSHVANTNIPEPPSHVENTSATAVSTVHESAPPVTRNILTADAHESCTETSKSVANLLKPSFFSSAPPSGSVMPSSSPSIPTAPPIYLPMTMQPPYGTPFLQPFPPPTPSASLAPLSTGITRDKVHVALQRLVQNDDFIDMVYREMLRTCSS